MDTIDIRHAEWEKALYSREPVTRCSSDISTATLLAVVLGVTATVIVMISFIVQSIWLVLF